MTTLRIIPKSQQARNQFNGGEIVENQPVVARAGSPVRPFGNLFYWAHARAVVDSTIGLHPHQGFEICSFVLHGSIRHFDTGLQTWRPLSAGDLQIIRAGNGISHSEFMAAGSDIFQIWFDPNLEKTLRLPASYDDYRNADFPVAAVAGGRIKTIAGPGSPLRMDTPGVEIVQLEVETEIELPADPEKIYSVYVLAGPLTINGEPAVESDFAVLAEQTALRIAGAGTVFVIGTPAEPGYATYAQPRRQANY